MARKSSKTAHVMNLLAGEEAESSKEEAARENLAARQTSDSTEKIRELTDSNQPTSPPTPISIIDMSSSAPDPVAELIREQLEEAEGMEDAPEPETPSLEQETEPDVPEISIPSFQYLNVMEHIVKNAVSEYMNKFDVCNCDRCTADVTALALSHLPPKYIVAENSTASPLLNFYSTRFSQQVVVELTKACSAVKENPHH
ncbi:late competence development ComFB family protein [Lacrimispora sphenoides]|uniref:Competence protein ComFB n=1 Tax=Lacrimispora sphenoides JCM 1415 TaxID=1297793 RepID=A0ABY1CD57_9FIRM|nr:late competence development ComFB family protein [Lacrimispora sphenoides]SET93519.1 competence protein ComFB [[Clostridium] sphenoides JCM 1415]SUY52499.1 late competence development protein ComFB [Lacrimispora sphenoides]